MSTFCCFSLEIIKKTAIKFVKGGLLFGGLAFLAGCTNSFLTSGGTAETRPEVVGKGDRARVLVSDLPQTVSMNQNGSETMVTLLYESPGGAVPASCYLDLDSRARIVETTSCACADGICRVGVRPQAGVYGEGSFAFHLVDTAKVVSDAGSVKVKILPVTISVFSGDGQKGIVGTELPLPIVVSVQNSEKAPVSGVKVSWKLGKGGRILCTTDESDYQGRVQCDWILGTEVDPGEISSTHGVEASIFVQGEGGDRKGTDGQGSHEPLPAHFTATVKSGPVSQLAFSPKKYPESGLVAGENLGSVVIYPQDAYGNLTETSKDLVVVLSLDSKPDGGALSGGEPLGDDKKRTMPPKWRGGSFSEKALWLEKAGTYSLKASSPELEEAAIGKEFVVVPDKAKRLVFAQQPGGGAAGAVWDRQPRVLIQDTYGNGATEPLMVTVSTVENLEAKDFGGALSLKGDGGTVAFKDLKINKAGRYKLKASAPPLEVVESEFFIIDPASANQLVFTKQPSGGSAGVPWVQQPQVAVLDPFGNKVTSFSGDVMIAIRTSSGSSPVQVLKGKTTVKVDGGEASFAGLSFDLAGDYILTAMSSGLFWSDTKQFSVTPGPGVRLAFVGELKNGTAGVALAPSPQVIIEDDFGNMVTTSAAEVTLALGANPGQGILSGTTLGAIKVPAANGVASFAGLSINKSGVGYSLKAYSGDLTGAQSRTFDITHGPAAKLVFTSRPRAAREGMELTPQPIVTIQDAHGNVVTSGPDAGVLLTMSLGSGAGTLSGKTSVAAVSGVAKWTDLAVSTEGEKVLRVTKPDTKAEGTKGEGTGSLTENSKSFNVSPKEANNLVFIIEPGGGPAGAAWAQQPKVAIQDDSGKTVTSFSGNVTLKLGANPGGEDLLRETTIQAVDGVVTFAGLSINKVGKYTLEVSGPRLIGESSKEFEITHGPAANLVFTTQPGGAAPGKAFATQPVVEVQDKYDNTVTTGADGEATLAVSLNSGDGTLSGTASVKAALGVATWSGLSIDLPGPKTLKVTKAASSSKDGSGELFALSDSFENKPIAHLLAVPAGVRGNAGDKVVTLDWRAAPGATSYNVLRGVRVDSLTKVGTSLTNVYKDSSVDNGTPYYYAVQAIYLEGTSGNSQSIQAKPLSETSIESLVVNDTGGGGALVASWKPSVGASSYTVKYSLVPGGANVGMDGCTVKAPAQTCIIKGLTPETKHYLIVKAINGYSGQVDSKEAEGIPRATPKLNLVGTDVSKEGEKGTFMSVGARINVLGPFDEFQYEFQYGKASGVYLEKIPAESGYRYFDYLDKSDSGVTHYFKGVVKFPNGSLSTAESSITAEPSPKIISALPGDGKVRVEWVPAKNALRHRIICAGAGTKGSSVIDVEGDGTSVEINKIRNLDWSSCGISATMSERLVANPKSGDYEEYVIRNGNGVTRFPATPELSLPNNISITRSVIDGGMPQGIEEVLLKEEDILRAIPRNFASAFYPKRPGSICGNTEGGCQAKIEVSYSDDTLTKVIDGQEGIKLVESGSLFSGAGNGIEASYSGKEGNNGMLLRFFVNQRAMEGTATITVKLTYGLETVTGKTRLILSPEKSEAAGGAYVKAPVAEEQTMIQSEQKTNFWGP